MKWFTRDWQHGALSDAEHDAATADYVAHIERIRESLSPALLHLSGVTGRFSLHDGWFIHSYWQTADTKDLVVDLAGWHQDRPLLHVRIVYRDAELLSPTQDVFNQIQRSPSTEILYGEVDLAPGGGFEHRLLLWPEEAGYFSVKFVDLDLVTVYFQGSEVEILNLD